VDGSSDVVGRSPHGGFRQSQTSREDSSVQIAAGGSFHDFCNVMVCFHGQFMVVPSAISNVRAINGETAMKWRTALIPAACALLVAGATGAYAYTGEQYAKEAKVTLKEARAIANKARAGTITDQELERESGGSGLRYSFDIKKGQTTFEVGVDAKTGKVLENKAEGPNPD